MCTAWRREVDDVLGEGRLLQPLLRLIRHLVPCNQNHTRLSTPRARMWRHTESLSCTMRDSKACADRAKGLGSAGDRRTPEVDLLEVLARPGPARLHRPPQLPRALVTDLVRAEVEGCELGAGGDGLGEGGCPVVTDLVL